MRAHALPNKTTHPKPIASARMAPQWPSLRCPWTHWYRNSTPSRWCGRRWRQMNLQHACSYPYTESANLNHEHQGACRARIDDDRGDAGGPRAPLRGVQHERVWCLCVVQRGGLRGSSRRQAPGHAHSRWLPRLLEAGWSLCGAQDRTSVGRPCVTQEAGARPVTRVGLNVMVSSQLCDAGQCMQSQPHLKACASSRVSTSTAQLPKTSSAPLGISLASLTCDLATSLPS